MKKRGMVLKLAALANAILLTVAFVTCPACSSRRDIIPPTISPVREDFQRFVPPTISPPPIDFERLVPPLSPSEKTPPAPPETKSDRRDFRP